MKGNLPIGTDFERIERQFAEFKAAWPAEAWRGGGADDREIRRAYFALAPSVEMHGLIMIALQIQKASVRWDNATYIPSPANWLGRRLFNEHPRGYPARQQTLADRCPDCGNTMRVHHAYPTGPGGKRCP